MSLLVLQPPSIINPEGVYIMFLCRVASFLGSLRPFVLPRVLFSTNLSSKE